MSKDAKPSPSSTEPATPIVKREKGIKIFMWPKVIFLYPTALVALFCFFGMAMIDDRTHDPTKPLERAVAPDQRPVDRVGLDTPPAGISKVDRFRSPQNLLAILFLVMLAFNLLVMALDFPRFTILAVVMGLLFLLFFLLWIGAFFHYDLLRPIHAIFGTIYAVANKTFYMMVFLTLLFVFGVIWITRWLDYWEVLPNEILHHHGPLSDLKRYPTMNLKFDKEIPDVLEWMLLGSGKLVLHIPNVEKAMVLENVPFITSKEEALKNVMSRLDVRISSDKDDAENRA